MSLPKLTEEFIMQDPSIHESAYNTTCDIANKMFGLMFHPNIYILLVIKELLTNHCRTYLEIGSFCGGSLCTVMQSNFKSTFYAIDTCLDFYMTPKIESIVQNNFSQYKLQNKSFPQPLEIEECLKKNAQLFNIHGYSSTLIKGDSRSRSTLTEIYQLSDDGIDLFFIDGGHDYQNVFDDFENYFSLVNPNGVIIFDDYSMGHLDVVNAVDDICKKYANELNPIGCIKNIVCPTSNHQYIPCYIIQKNNA